MFISLVRKRRSIRKYLEKPIEGEKIDILIEAALCAPSSRGFQPWSFIIVTDPAILEKLSRSKEHGSAFLKGAPLGIVVCADPGKSDVWVEDASIAAILVQLAAESIGLGSCWIQIRERMHDPNRTAEAHVSDLLNFPANLKVACIIAVGYPAEEKAPHKKENLLYEKVHQGSFGNPFQG
ncbi:MAG: nitroreductase family protein [Deltaproteobacteria bacterium]|nr:nitroreductase family protein [Deltaproteobacteria bacterium]